jgi:hypothetical protein
MARGGSVPIVSQTEIDPIKTALSLMLALAATTALTEPPPVPKPPGPGGAARLHRERLRAGRHHKAAQRHMPVGMAPERELLPAQRRAANEVSAGIH